MYENAYNVKHLSICEGSKYREVNSMAEEKEHSIFRKKSTDYIDSPEKLDHYLHVTNPGVWALLLAVFFLLVGFCVWGATGKLETHATVAVQSENGRCVAYIPENILNTMVKIGKITVEGEECSLDFSNPEPMTITDSTNIYVRLAGGLNLGDVVYQVPLEEIVADGMYHCTVTTETISPMALLLN